MSVVTGKYYNYTNFLNGRIFKNTYTETFVTWHEIPARKGLACLTYNSSKHVKYS